MNKDVSMYTQLFDKIGIDNLFGNYVEIKRPTLCTAGDHNAIDSFFYCTVALHLGDYIHIAPQVTVIGGKTSYLRMDHFSFLATGTRVICGSEDYTAGGLMGATIPMQYRAPIKIAPVNIERFAGCGANCVLLPGVTLAEGSMVGAGSVITKSTEPWGIYIGSPAKLVKIKTDENIAKTLEYAKALGYE